LFFLNSEFRIASMKPMTPAPVLTDRVRNAIVDAIVDGSLRSGKRLAQEDIARRLGVSRQPVSHALSVLKQQGVLVELGRKGLTVAPMEPARLRGLYAVRAVLDGLAARAAAARIRDAAVPQSELEPLHALVAHYQGVPAGVPLAVLVNADAAFHVALYRLSGNPWIEEVTQPHWVHFRRCMHAVLEDRAQRGEVWPEHRAILDAVLAGDATRAGELAEQHASRAGETTAARLASYNDQQQQEDRP
jgi:DNA-binding GntR family transcriptional regulator